MGKAKIRKLCNEQTQWKVKGFPKHKHDYSLHAYVCIEYANGMVCYFEVMACTVCKSFKCISQEHNISGLITDLKQMDKNLPIIHFKSSRNIRIGFSNLQLTGGCYE